MTNRERLVLLLESDFDDQIAADVIANTLMSIKDEDNISIAVICGKENRLLKEWLGKEVEEGKSCG